VGSQCSAAAKPGEAVAKDGRPLSELTAAEIASTPAYSYRCLSGDRLNFAVCALAGVLCIYVIVNMAQTFTGKHAKSQ